MDSASGEERVHHRQWDGGIGTLFGAGKNKTPLLSQEGWREAPGWFQSRNPEGIWFRNHPSRDPLRDPAALLTQEGSLPYPQRHPRVHAVIRAPRKKQNSAIISTQ